MNFANQDLSKKIGVSLHKAGNTGVSYIKCLLDLLTGRMNVFF